MPINSQMRQEVAYFHSAHVFRVLFFVKQDKPLDPIDVNLLGSDAVMLHADCVANFLKKGRALRC